MKDSNTLASIVTRNLQTREIFQDTKGQYMKESNSLASSAKQEYKDEESLTNYQTTVNEGFKFPGNKDKRFLTSKGTA